MKKFVVIFTIFLFFLFTGYIYKEYTGDFIVHKKDASGASSHYPVTIETYSSSGEKIKQVFIKKPNRVVTHELNTFETLVALGQADTVVATSVDQNGMAWKRMMERYPQELKKVQVIDNYEPNAEGVLAANPDLIIGWKSTFTSVLKKSTEWWNSRGVRTYIVSTSNHITNKGTIADECKYLQDMGKIFDVEEKTNQMVLDIKEEIDNTRKQIKDRQPQKTMVIEMSGKAFMNYDNGWVVGDMVEQLGGYMPVKSKRIGYEDLIAEDPDVIFLVYFNEEGRLRIIDLFKEAGFSSLRAVKEERIYPIPFDHMYTPATKTIEGLRMIKKGLYPDMN